MSQTHDGKHVILGLGLAFSALLSALTGGFWWFLTTFTFESFVDREAYQSAALGLVVCALGTGLLGVLVWHLRQAPLWSLAAIAVSVLAQLAWAAHQLVAASATPRSGPVDYTAEDLWVLMACPTSWPLLALAVVSLVQLLRARSSRGRPAPLGR